MSLFILLLLGTGLAMDAFAVSISNGITIKNIKVKDAFLIAFFFGVFQAVMPVFGWLLGKGFSSFIAGFDHWIVFLILAFIGLKMIYEAFKEENSEEENILKIRTLFILAIATSIDALAVGVGFSLMKIDIVYPVLIIGITTFFISFTGVYIGKKLGSLFGKRMEIAGGIILILIGLKILLEAYNIIKLG